MNRSAAIVLGLALLAVGLLFLNRGEQTSKPGSLERGPTEQSATKSVGAAVDLAPTHRTAAIEAPIRTAVESTINTPRATRPRVPVIAAGRVVSTAGTPIQAAHVELLPLTPAALNFVTTMTTGASGKFRFTGETDTKRFVLRVIGDNFKAHTTKSFDAGTDDHQIALTSMGTLTGHFESRFGWPVIYEVTLQPSGSFAALFLDTNKLEPGTHYATVAKGEFTLSQIPLGTYDLHIYGYHSKRLAQSMLGIEVTGPDSLDERLRPIPHSIKPDFITFKFTTDPGIPMPMVSVHNRFDRGGHPVWQSIASTQTGEITLPMLSQNTQFLIDAVGFNAVEVHDPSNVTEVRLTSAPTVRIQLTRPASFKHLEVLARFTRVLDAPRVFGMDYSGSYEQTGPPPTFRFDDEDTTDFTSNGPGKYDVSYFISDYKNFESYTSPPEQITIAKDTRVIQLTIDPQIDASSPR